MIAAARTAQCADWTKRHFWDCLGPVKTSCNGAWTRFIFCPTPALPMHLGVQSQSHQCAACLPHHVAHQALHFATKDSTVLQKHSRNRLMTVEHTRTADISMRVSTTLMCDASHYQPKAQSRFDFDECDINHTQTIRPPCVIVCL